MNGERPSVRIYNNGKLYRKSVAKLVLSSFYYREGCECAHIIYLDGNTQNCKLSNLRYVVDQNVCEDTDVKVKASPEISVKTQSVKQSVLRSCLTCRKNPCFSGMENFTTDFGAEGCRKYKPREEE
jgi:hypothetical protein